MKEVLLTLLNAVIMVAVPIATGAFCGFLKKKSAEVQAKTANTVVNSYVREITDAVATAVTFTSQTYVDGLKKDGIFSLDSQTAALNLAIETARDILSKESIAFIERAYGDVKEYLTTRIEAEVHDQKNGYTKLIASN
jgi:hypothetical protein